jgi:phosphoglycolate phosphatase
MKKLILFDLDGTLLDTLEDLASAVNHALELRRLQIHTVDEYRRMVGHGVRNLVQQALPSRADDALVDAALADFKTYYQAHIAVNTHPYPGIPELLADLQAYGVQLAVASNKFQEGTEYLIQRFFPGIDFVAILGNRPGFPLKPDPEIVQEVLRRSGVAAEGALLVGDSPTDMRTAANGGIKALAVTWGYRSAEELAGNHLIHSVQTLRTELFRFVSSRQ